MQFAASASAYPARAATGGTVPFAVSVSRWWSTVRLLLNSSRRLCPPPFPKAPRLATRRPSARTSAPSNLAPRPGQISSPTHPRITTHTPPGTDQLLLDIAEYVAGYEIKSHDAVRTARYAVLDATACALLALNFPECAKLLGNVVPGMSCEHGAGVIGTEYSLDPVTAAHNTSTAIRWLEYNDAWLGKEWTHPSDAIGAILPLCEYVSKIKMAKRLAPLTMKDVLVATIKAYEIVGVLAMENSLNQIGVDSGVFTKVAVASVCTRLLGGGRREVASTC